MADLCELLIAGDILDTVLSPTLTSKQQTKATNMQRTIDEMRQHIAKLKSELESEKTRNKQSHRDKVIVQFYFNYFV